MMKKYTLFLSLCLLAGGLNAQKLNKKVLFTVENDTVTAEEYMAVYNKNRDIGEEIDPKTPEEYLDLYINFKLKVHEAKELGKDTMPAFKREFKNYREQLTKPYLSDKDVTKELIREAYSRMKWDIRASHIMVSLPQNPTPEDTLAAYNKIIALKEKIEKGEKFEDVAKNASDDTYSAKKWGDLGYFTVFDMVYPFETAAYETRVGKISKPIRSKFGYHIVKPMDKREARGKVKVAHLMLVDNDKTSNQQREDVKKKIEEIYQKLEEGADFRTLVKQYSEDKSSIPLGGVLDEFGINKMYPEFESAAFALQDSGQYSEPVKTPVGWHIIMLIDKIGIDDFESVEGQIRNKVERDDRARQSQVSVMRRIKKDYKFKEYPKNFEKLFGQVDEGFLTRSYKLPAKIRNQEAIIFEFEKHQYKVKDLLGIIANRQARYGRGGNMANQLYRLLKDYQEEELLAYEKSKLSEKYPDFRNLEREYYEGILLFDLTEEKVWRKAMADTLGLEEFFEANRSSYQWDNRYQVYLVDAASKKIAKKASKKLAKGNSRESVMTDLNIESKLNLNIDSALAEANQLADWKELVLSEEEPGKTAVKEFNGRFKQAVILDIQSARQKELSEAKGRVVSDYQNYLEEEWIKSLKARYTVKINQDVLSEVVKELE
ncbi:MAG: peptidylprolyl isomerase [Bacteroidetes bacterium]|nr:peptidylprolyl isomerase [Bacteroidota bacterium]